MVTRVLDQFDEDAASLAQTGYAARGAAAGPVRAGRLAVCAAGRAGGEPVWGGRLAALAGSVAATVSLRRHCGRYGVRLCLCETGPLCLGCVHPAAGVFGGGDNAIGPVSSRFLRRFPSLSSVLLYVDVGLLTMWCACCA